MTLHQEVTERLRGIMGERRISREQLRNLCGWSRGYVNRRYTGEAPLDVNDLEALERRGGIPVLYLLTGDSQHKTTPAAKNTIRRRLTDRELVAWLESARQPTLDPTTDIAANVRAELARRQVNSGMLTRLLGLSHSAVSRRMRGETPFRDHELQQVAEYLGVPVASFNK